MVQATIDTLHSDHCYISPPVRHSTGDTGHSGPSGDTGGHGGPMSRVSRVSGVSRCATSKSVTSIILNPCNKIRKGQQDEAQVECNDTSDTGTRYQTQPVTADTRSRAKFKFQMKFVAGSDGSLPGRPLCHPSKLNRTHYHKRKAAIKNSFCQSTVKPIQVRKFIIQI